MKKTIAAFAAIALTGTLTIVACNSANKPSENKEGLQEPAVVAGLSKDEQLVARGHYLVNIMGCNDCHSPKVMGPQGPAPDSSRLLSGHPASLALAPVAENATKGWMLFNPTLTAYVGPWGTSFAANISSDATGIGNWTEEQFFRAMREGKYKGMENGRPLLPPMPWQGFRNATDEDLRAIFHYLKSTQPVENRVPAPIPPAAKG